MIVPIPIQLAQLPGVHQETGISPPDYLLTINIHVH